MEFWNYCPTCGKRLVPNDSFCSACGTETVFEDNDEVYFFQPPIHNIGFFNLKIDFSPYIIRNSDFDYDICYCGYINDINNEFCYHCGVKRIEKGLSRFIKRTEKPKFVIGTIDYTDKIFCECGAVNQKDNVFCEMCGCKLDKDSIDEYYSNFNLEFENPIFCFCGKENDEHSWYCENCGLPFDSYNRLDDIKKLCVCSVLNEATSEFCTECGNRLSEEISEIICVCGCRNHINSRVCSSCERPLNPKRVIKSKIVCSCGKIMDFDSEYCPNCGKNIKKIINRRKTFSNAVNLVKNVWDGI